MQHCKSLWQHTGCVKAHLQARLEVQDLMLGIQQPLTDLALLHLSFIK